MKIKDVEASLQFGRLYGMSSKLVCYGSLVLVFVILGFTIFLAALPSELLEWDQDMIIGMIALNILAIIAFSVTLWIEKVNIKHRKQVLLWLEDAIEMRAYSMKLDWEPAGFFKVIKIQVQFNYDGENLTRNSIGADKNNVGYNHQFNKYANKEIRILYSPKYDQVMILKESK